MRVFSITSTAISESDALPAQAPEHGFIWIGCTRQELEGRLTEIQSCLQALCGIQLLDLHVSDLLNAQLASNFDYTSQYDLLVFRRLASQSQSGEATTMQPAHRRGGPPILRHIDTSPVGFAIFENVLLSVHPRTVPYATPMRAG